ncbi:nicotinate-nucleotide adenylyltransferase [Desulfitobacterium chlororespirans]|uniref:Probable nicotinate-nucleotide adenylyltransferase n=1 Tax=Desulfitobacterium chlororespirans DSM 11544 TaxID=1121395 RepID=A0A1M7US74_9FIRM|nr:nicotinate-nucleotide adenylyltransferase [Desulfitobacterium chlororespirans]SHN85861.1 nicotinate-nucleotide adenylyltransferase [Desulfitobacterium chlororespirans DSM 11544]
MNINAPPKRIGIMGGTFDPLHYGHLVAAEMARHEFALEKVIFIPTGNPPHKVGRRVTSPGDRYEMVKRAVRDNRFFEVSDLEILREGYSYTVDTLKDMHELYPQHELYFITGADAFREIFTWREVQSVLSLSHFIGASRPGFDPHEFLEELKRDYPEFLPHMHLFDVPALAISSTDIRSRVKEGKPIRYLLPESVRLYIEEADLYRA